MRLNRGLLREDWAQRMIHAMEESFDRFTAAYAGDPPTTPAKWYHFYFCDDCGVPLHWDIAQPKAHACAACGKVFTGDPYDGCWAKMLNGAIVANMETAAVLALVQDDPAKYLEFVRHNMLYFAEHYHEYTLKNEKAKTGKVFPQGLTEAIFLIAMERCLRLLRDFDLFTDAEMTTLKERLFLEGAKLLESQPVEIHNISQWMQAAIGACARVLGDEGRMRRSIYGAFGWKNQLHQGCRRDGMWYEISPGYHFYTMKALLSHADVAREMGIDLYGDDLLKRMGTAAVRLSYPDGTMPGYNDCSCHAPLDATVYEQLLCAYDDAAFRDALARRCGARGEYELSCFAPLPNPWRIRGDFAGHSSYYALFETPSHAAGSDARVEGSMLLADSGIAILQNDAVRVDVKATKYGGGHDHNDKISIDVYDKLRHRAVSYDLGTSGYGIDLTSSWLRSSAAHNLVIVDGRRQAPCDAQLAFFGGDSACFAADGAYPGVELLREVTLRADGFEDAYRVACDREATIDYVFHCVGTATLVGADTVAVEAPLYADNGYPHLKLRRAAVDGDVRIAFEEDGVRRELHVRAQPGTEVFVGECYGESRLVTLGIAIVRRRGRETTYRCALRM